MTQFIGAGFQWYGVLIALGMVVGMFCAYLAARYRGWTPDISFDICILAIPLAVIGARLNYVFWDAMAGGEYNFWSVIGFSGGADATPKDEYIGMEGLSIYGGLMGAVLGIWINSLIYKRKGKPETFLNMMDLGAPFMVLGQAIGRWGNFANGEVYGPEITNPAWQWFPIGVNIDGTWHQAFFFYESLLNFACAAFCLWMLLGRRRSAKGAVVSVYFIWYGIVRACMELSRDPEFIMEGALGLPTSFIMAILEIVIGLIILLSIVYRARVRGTKVPLFLTREQWKDAGFDLWDWGRDPSEKLPPLFQKKKTEDGEGLTEEEYARAEAAQEDEEEREASERDGDSDYEPTDVPEDEDAEENAEETPYDRTAERGAADSGFARKKFAGRDGYSESDPDASDD